MKLGCCAYSYRDLLTSGDMSLESFLDAAVEIGCDGVELTQYYFGEETPEYLNHVKREAFRRGLDVAGTAVGGNFSAASADARARQIEHVKDWLAKSARLGSPVLRVFAGGCPEGIDEEQARRWVREGLDGCLEAARQHGVVLALENHGGLTASADGTLDLLAPFADEPWIGLNLDLGNFTGDIYAQYARCAPHAVTAHAKVSVAQGDGRELVDYGRALRVLRQGGYRGYLSIEYEEPGDPVVGVARFAAYLRGCLSDA